MPLSKPVRALTEITCKEVCSWFRWCARKWPGIKDRQLQRNYVFSVVDPRMRQHLLATVMATNMHEIMLDEKVTMLELLGDKTTNTLDLTTSGYQYVEEVFNFYRAVTYSLAVNLTTIGIVCRLTPTDRKYVQEINGIFYRTMLQMKNLTYVTMKGLGDAEMVTILGKTCHNLTHLDISNSHLIDDESIAALLTDKAEELFSLWEGKTDSFIARCYPCCKTLKFLGISETAASSQVTCSLLQLLPNLQSFGGYLDQGSMCHAIGRIYGVTEDSRNEEVVTLDLYEIHKANLIQICRGDVNGNVLDQSEKAADEDSDLETDLIPRPHQLLLTHIWDVQITEKMIESLNIVCPNVVAVDTHVSSLDALQKFHLLKSLSVDCDFKYWTDIVWYYLESSGSSLTSLLLKDPSNGCMPLNCLKDLCPKLQSLTMPIDFSDTTVCSNWESLTYANISVPTKETLSLLCSVAVNLKELYVTFNPEPYSDWETEFSDQLITEILSFGGFDRVEKLIIGKCFFSGKSLAALCTRCPVLHTLGYTDLWAKLTRDQVDIVKTVIRGRNLNVQMLISTDYPGNKLLFL